MPRKQSPPRYRLHKARKCAVVTIRGKNHYLGPYGSPESHEAYARLIAERFPGGKACLAAGSETGAELTISELILRYWTEHVQVYYRKNGKPTDRQYHVRLALRPLRKLYGGTLAQDFGPKTLQAVREEIIADGQKRRGGLNRNYVNDHISIIKEMFRWAVAEELVPVHVHHALQTVKSIHKGRDLRVHESRKVLPAPEKDVLAVMKIASPQIRALIELQLLTGMRPDEATIMRPCDISRNGDIWTYVPQSHKMEHRGIEKTVLLGPRAQRLLAPWLDRAPAAYLFSPREVYEAAIARHANGNKTRRRRCRKGHARPPRDHYDDDTYCQAVERACKRAGVPKWTPGQLRHNAGTRIRRKYGLEAARLILGHRSAATTEIYAEKDMAGAIQLVKEMG
jgi:integrase